MQDITKKNIIKTFEKLNNLSQTEFDEVMEVENSNTCGYGEEIMKDIWTGGKNDNFVCKVDGTIVGHISFNSNSKRRNGSIYMVNLTVLPKYRKQGIAKGLINIATDFYIKQGVQKPMSLQVDFDNTPAINLYKKVGYQIVTPICEADEDDEQYIMEASLSNLKSTTIGREKE